MHVLNHSPYPTIYLLGFIILVSCADLDLNRSPPTSSSSDIEPNIRSPSFEGNNQAHLDNDSSGLHRISENIKATGREARSSLVEDAQDSNRPQKRVKFTYPPNMTEKEKKALRSKRWYAGLVSTIVAMPFMRLMCSIIPM